MQTYIEIILLGYIFSLILTREFLLCAHGRAGQTQLLYWWRISQSEIRNSAAAEKNWNRKARAGKNSFPPTPFLFARPSDWILKFEIQIFVKKCSNFVQKTPPIFKKGFRTKFLVLKPFLKNCGEGEIRTPGTISDTQSFQDCPLDRSGTSPFIYFHFRAPSPCLR